MRTFLVLLIDDENRGEPGSISTRSYQARNFNSVLPAILEDGYLGQFDDVKELSMFLTNGCEGAVDFIIEVLDITNPMNVHPVFDWEFNDG
ncbi:MAG: hypothetical protein CMB80_02145 [Flammeovirgaceae bacterium]|nr:hypothetical protein [Flammeovirgaceae bacterium]|tara:strand:- start:172 stop:444 length:273 start_codon:yes stop_codon:yes gene_type:complete